MQLQYLMMKSSLLNYIKKMKNTFLLWVFRRQNTMWKALTWFHLARTGQMISYEQFIFFKEFSSFLNHKPMMISKTNRSIKIVGWNDFISMLNDVLV